MATNNLRRIESTVKAKACPPPPGRAAAEARRRLEVLWRLQESPKRGPKPSLGPQRIAQAAIRIADRHGLAAVSMRRVADRLGTTAMALYTYVPGKAELLDLMHDEVLAEVLQAPLAGTSWRARLEQVARENWALFDRHPWLLQVSMSRPVLGLNLFAKYDRELAALEGIGLSGMQMDSILTATIAFVAGAARFVADATAEEEASGMSQTQWWLAVAPLLDRLFDPTRFPRAAKVGADTSDPRHWHPAHAFEFGLPRLLDGIEAYITADRARKRRR